MTMKLIKWNFPILIAISCSLCQCWYFGQRTCSRSVWGRRKTCKGARARWNEKQLFSLRAGDTTPSQEADDSDGPIVEYSFSAKKDDLDDNSRTNQEVQHLRVLILLDCFCPYHGIYLAQHVLQTYPNVAVVFCVSDYLKKYLQVTDPDNDQWHSDATSMPTPPNLAKWKQKIVQGYLQHHSTQIPVKLELVGVYCESDSGLADAERLRERLNVTCRDDPIQLEARRNKYFMNKRVREHGLEVCEQRLCKTAGETRTFAQTLFATSPTGRVVVKPVRGVATESVYLCSSLEEVSGAWDKITATKVFGSSENVTHDSVLVQEFLEGTEYALDVISRNGAHKVAAIWRYDKRPGAPGTGAAFCYFQTKLIDAEQEEDSRVVGIIADYIMSALDALGVKWGLSHNEVIVVDNRGPVLVEVNCRQHNMDFSPLTMACIGYNALDMTADALLGNPERSSEDSDDREWWNGKYPSLPTLRAAGCMAHLVCFQSGTVVGVNHLDEIQSLESVFDSEIYETFSTLGSVIEPTVDIRTDAGWVQMIHEDSAHLQRDFDRIVEFMPTLFNVMNRVDEGKNVN